MKNNCVKIALFGLLGASAAGSMAEGDISPSRPSFTGAATTVGKGRLQIESGLRYQSVDKQSLWSGSESLVRYGFGPKLELQAQLPSYIIGRKNQGAIGWNDGGLGALVQIGPVKAFDLALLIATSAPVGARNLTSGHFDPNFALNWGRDMGKGYSLAGTVSVNYSNDHNHFLPSYWHTLQLSRDVGHHVSAFIEGYQQVSPGARPSRIFNFGAVKVLDKNRAVDFAVGQRFSGNAVANVQVTLGYSVRF